MDNEKTTSVSTSKKNVQIPGKYRCKLFSPKKASTGKGELDWLATADCPQGEKPENPNIPVPYYFTYDRLVDLGGKVYEEDLIEAFNQPDIISVEPQFSDHVKLVEDRELRLACGECFASGNCKYESAFCKVYKNYYFLEVKFCPWCKETNRLRPSSKPTGFAPIHDVRRDGYPSLLYFEKIAKWKCTYCGKTVSGIRVPRVQHTLKGEFTLRLLRSLFELGMDKVPNDYVAEGYCLLTNTVDKLNKQFRTTSEEEFEAHLVDLFSRRTRKDFYDEPVLLEGKLFRAVFDDRKETLIAILPENKCKAIYEFVSGFSVKLNTFKSSSSLNQAMQFCLTASPVAGREVIASATKLFYDYSLDLKEDEKGWGKKRHSSPKWNYEREREFSYNRELISTELASFISDTFYCRPVNLEDFDRKMSEWSRIIPSTYKRTLRQLEELKEVIITAQENPHKWEERFVKKEQQLCDLEIYFREDIENITRLDISELIESCSKGSEFSLSEQLARLQYYNELSVFPISPSEQEKFPVLDEKGWPSFENTRLGQGIPVECLTHLLKNGLLDKNARPAACIRQRLGLYKHECTGGTCTIENCPFLS